MIHVVELEQVAHGLWQAEQTGVVLVRFEALLEYVPSGQILTQVWFTKYRTGFGEVTLHSVQVVAERVHSEQGD